MNDKSVICVLSFQYAYENRLEECPLYYMEEKKFVEKLALIEEKNEQEKAEILKRHRYCKNKFYGFENGLFEIINQQIDTTLIFIF